MTLLLLMMSHGASAAPADKRDAAAAVSRGLTFLMRAQRQDGGFPSQMCGERSMTGCRQERSLFPTALIVEALLETASHAPNEHGLKPAIERGLDYLADRREPHHPIWRYWAREDPMHEAVGPDLDDTAVISSILRRAGRPVPENRELLPSEVVGSGAFRTWFGIDDSPDCIVNLNVLEYLARLGDGSERACSWIREVVQQGTWGSCSPFYEDPWSFPFAFARAWGHGLACLAPAADALKTQLLGSQPPAEALGEALALAAWSGLGECGEPVPELRAALLSRQRADGSWPEGPFFRGPGPSYFGSPELTTAIAVQALDRHRRTCEP